MQTTDSEIQANRMILQAIRVALRELKVVGDTSRSSVIFHLSELFIGVTESLEAAHVGEIGYDTVLDRLRSRASELGIERWVDHNVAEVHRMFRERMP
ncbi:hypothetical protein [Tahibacter amnicola]|uniref:Uncharacterized protein n=1 Tax=Tahibacter amnicola TaxID=2976241 RepID=A0ABY6BPM1_9GAMM|nr:hypothetical protein [Tahibacter amnicola]UXI70360.1 hypothetical protein N4264_12220 [Tahibacter amnicola]